MKKPLFQAAALLLVAFATSTDAADRPNFVWILSEDNSKHYLKLFDEHGAETPNIAELAENGLLFNHAFSCSPVCSVARTTLATSVYGPRLGTQYHRKLATVSLPDDWHMFPWYLNQAGYYTTNNSKTDYNAKPTTGVWDESSKKATWRKRGEGQPFFHMESHAASHESSLHFANMNQKTSTDPDSVTVWPYFPDTKLFRYTTARYHDRMREIDRIVRNTVSKLEQDGLLEDTFIFYFGDHGGVLPASKGYIYERGVHVPLVVRVPKKWRHLVHQSMPNGSRVDGFVSFVDFGPTVLQLAGVEVPKHVDGTPFLGPELTLDEVNARDETFTYADRFDEKYDLVRGVRKGKYKYLRNYHAFYPDGLQNNYRYRMLAYQQWREHYRAGKLNEQQEQFFQRRPAEALYDLSADPHELNNLAGDPKFADVLADLRTRLTAKVKGLPDLSMVPESEMVRHVDTPIAYGQQIKPLIGKAVDTADLALLPFDKAEPQLKQAIASDQPVIRYWAMIVCSTFGDDAKPLTDHARKLLTDDDLMVRVRAAEFLAIIGAEQPQPTLMGVLAESDSHVEALLALNTVVFLRDTLGYEFHIAAKDVKSTGGNVGRRLEYLAE